LRIARPILLVSTPIGVIFGLREAWRLAGPELAVRMAAKPRVVGPPVRGALAAPVVGAELGRSPTDAGIVPYHHLLIEANADRFVDPGNADLVLPGQLLRLPSLPLPSEHSPR